MQKKIVITKQQQKKLGQVYKFIEQHYPIDFQELLKCKLFANGHPLANKLAKNFYSCNESLQLQTKVISTNKQFIAEKMPHKEKKEESIRTPHVNNIADLVMPTEEEKKYAPQLVGIHRSVKKCSRCFLASERDNCQPATLPLRKKDAGGIFVVIDQIDFFSQSVDSYFIDEAGVLLTKILNAVNISLDEVYYTSLLKCTSAIEISAKLNEARVCLQHFSAELNFFKPNLLLMFGEDAYKLLMPNISKTKNFSSIRGKTITASFSTTTNTINEAKVQLSSNESSTSSNGTELQKNDTFKCIFTHHPREIIRDSGLKREVWNDLKPHIPLIKNHSLNV